MYWDAFINNNLSQLLLRPAPTAWSSRGKQQRQRFGRLRSISISGNAFCSRSRRRSRNLSAAVGGSGPQILSRIASLTEVRAYSARSTIHHQENFIESRNRSRRRID
jgi:hypothetical protein